LQSPAPFFLGAAQGTSLALLLLFFPTPAENPAS
jgi:hypothetical protein